jgi:hypothetical protein
VIVRRFNVRGNRIIRSMLFLAADRNIAHRLTGVPLDLAALPG